MSAMVLDDVVLEFLQHHRLMVSAASRNADHVPSVARGIGYQLARDGGRLAVFLCRTHAEQLLADVRATELVAVVFSEPHTHRTLQLKGSDARVGPLQARERAGLPVYADLVAEELTPLGYREDWARTVIEADPAQVLAIRFTPESAYAQTPGPRAGAPLGGARL